MLKRSSDSDSNFVVVQVNTTTVYRFVFITIGVLLLIGAVYLARQPLTLITIAFFLALGMSPPVNWIADKLPGKDNRGFATAIAYITVLLFFGTILYFLIPPLVSQTQVFVDQLPNFIADLQNGNNFVAHIVQHYDLQQQLYNLQSDLASKFTNLGGPLVSFLQAVFSNLASVLLVLALTFFMLVEGPSWIEKYWRLQNPHKREHRQELADQMYRVIVGFVSGQLLVASIAASATFVVLTIVGVQFALPLAMLVGVFGMVPFVGPTIAAVVVVLVSLFKSPAAAIIMLVYYIIYQQIENNFIIPTVQSRTVKMSSMLIFIASLIGVYLLGILGAVVAIPIAGCIRVLVIDYLEHRHLIDESK